MDPVLQFDPANLCIWYRPVPPSDDDTDTGVLDRVALAALHGRHADAVELVDGITDVPRRVRSANVLGAVWHEQRHFVDVLLTTFGQSVFRRCTSLLVRLPEVLEAGRAAGAIGVPLSMYHHRPAKLRLAGVSADERLARVAGDIKGRERMLADDARQHALPSGGAVSVGGWAQLEALGYLTQMSAVQEGFGPELSYAVQRDMPDRDRLRHQYEWAVMLANAMGLSGSRAPLPDPSDEPDVMTALVPAVTALFYGTLMVRRWGQEQTEVDGGHTGAAAARVDPLMRRLRRTGTLAAATSATEAWQAVDEACGQVFGRSATEELATDLAFEGRFCEQVTDAFGHDSSTTDLIVAAHAARRRLAGRFQADPEIVIDPGNYATLLAEVFPVPIIATPGGNLNPGEAGRQPLWTMRSDLGGQGSVSWSWASAPLTEVTTSGRIHTVGDPTLWTDAVESCVPMVKILLNGWREPAAFGPELMRGEARLAHFGAEVRYDPLVRLRPGTGSVPFWYLSGRTNAVCDGCNAALARGAGHYLSGSYFRQSDALLRWMLDRYGGGPSAALLVRMDFSGWLLCDRCRHEVGTLGGRMDNKEGTS